MRFDIITIFPDIFNGFLDGSLLARGQKKKIIQIKIHNLRKWADGKHKKVDDRPYGGGPGMVFLIEPIYKAVKKIQGKNKRTKVILFSPRGKELDQNLVKKLAKSKHLIIICGRYEGVDERVADYIADEVLSIGDYVLNGGEVAAMVLIETVSRMIPGFIAKEQSAQKYDHAQFGKPEVFEINRKRLRVPKVLLSGNHEKIEEWRRKHSK